MSWSDIVTFFIALFISVFSVSVTSLELIKSTVRANNLYSTYVITACQDALEMELADSDTLSEKESNQEKDSFWKRAETRENAVNTFYKSLGLSLNKKNETYYNDLELMSPIICLIDYDGFYLSYNAAFDDNATTDENNLNFHNITMLNTWAENIGTYTIRYYLTDKVEVYSNTGKQYIGNRKEVYENIYKETSDETLAYFMDDAEFSLSRNACVIQHINEQVEYYINNMNLAVDSYDTQYSLYLAENQGETWAGMIDNPTIMAFIQGPTYNIRQKHISVFGLGAYDYDEPLHYFICEEEGVKIYRCYEEELWRNKIQKIEGKVYYNGIEIQKFYESAKACVKAGAYPSAD